MERGPWVSSHELSLIHFKGKDEYRAMEGQGSASISFEIKYR